MSNPGQTKSSASALKLDPKNPAIWFGLGLCVVMLVPIIPLAPWLQTFIHPWRPELAASLFMLGFLVWGISSTEFRDFLKGIGKAELFAIILPCAAFMAWSFCSALYAASWRSALHHSLIWCIYLALYIFLRYFLNRAAHTKTIIVAAVGAAWIVAIPAVFEYYTSVSTADPTTIGIRYSKYAEMLNTLAPLVIAYTLRLKGRAFWLGAFTVILLWLFAISTLSRSAAGLHVVGLAAMTGAIFVIRKFRAYRAKFSLLLPLLIVIPVLLHAPSLLGSRGVPLVDRMQDQSITESNNVRPFFSKIALEMFKAHPFTGIGADNFGREFNRYREIYAKGHPDDPNLSIAEAEIPERAHNEIMQIAAELGVPGLLIIGWFLAGIAWMFLRALKRRLRISLPAYGALVGIILFLASSLVMSYSFRMLQNGFIFFLVLGIAAKGLLSARAKERPAASGLAPFVVRVGFSTAIVCCILLAILSVSRAAGVWYGYRAATAVSADEANSSFQRSYAFDDQNASVYAVNGLYHFNAGNFAGAAPPFRKAIDLGRATTIDYSYLASSQVLAGDAAGAEATLAEGVRIYPLSVFIRTRYAAVLNEAGKSAEAEEQFKVALKIEPRQAEIWRNLINNGAASASQASFDRKLPPVMDLKPKSGIYAVLAEREVRHPEEKTESRF